MGVGIDKTWHEDMLRKLDLMLSPIMGFYFCPWSAVHNTPLMDGKTVIF
jgi:hypothetical protein